MLLQEPDGSAIPARLAERLGISTGSVTAPIDRLERLGYVARAAIRSFFIGVKCDTAVNRTGTWLRVPHVRFLAMWQTSGRRTDR